MNAPVPALAQLSHVLWRGNQMGSGRAPVLASGHKMLDQALPNGGWPGSALIELLLQQSGIGEMRLLKPALCSLAARRRVALVQPPYLPQAMAWTNWGLAPERLLWIKTGRSSDALWAAEQILRNGSCGALLLWQPQMRPEALRRLHLAAQHADTVFWMMRPLSAASQSSPAPLRLGLRPAAGGISIDIIKRRGPQSDSLLLLPLNDVPGRAGSDGSDKADAARYTNYAACADNTDGTGNTNNAAASAATAVTAGIFSSFSSPDHAPVDRHLSATARARSIPPALV